MAATFKLVQWNARKLRYDAIVLVLVAAWIAGYVLIGLGRKEAAVVMLSDLLMSAFGTAALIMIHVVLAIGPLARLSPRFFLPMLYNRRHLGVILFCVALTHGLIGLGEILGEGSDTPLAKLLFGGRDVDEAGFPFELLGISALLIFAVMAFTSHDYWLHRVTPRVWKALHMAVYAAYALIVAHVVLGKLSSENGMDDTPYAFMVMVGGIALVALHVGAAAREHRIDTRMWPLVQGAAPGRWIDAGLADDIPEGRARIVAPPNGERIAIFRHNGTVCAVANVCSHQNGPLGEGCIVDGLVTCPWHGYQFKLDDGCAPGPYTDRVATYRVRLEGRRVFVDAAPQPLGASNPPVRLPV